jgi:hypothetical protein
MDLLTEYPPKHFFCVSTDKAANPVNIMGASKRIMEDLVMAYNDKFKVTTARFDNVAFSNGSLPDGWIHRLQKKQPLAAPSDVKRYFVSPEELKNNPFKKIKVKEEKLTKKGLVLKEIDKVQWVEPVAAGKYTRAHKAFAMAKTLLDKWMKEHHEKDCYPPTIINITDGAFNGIANPREVNTKLANELKALFTNDGNVLLWNIHITPDNKESIVLPISKTEVVGDDKSEGLYDMSSLLPSRYNQPIGDLRGDAENSRHVAMAINSDLSTLIQLMDIGTPTNISQK